MTMGVIADRTGSPEAIGIVNCNLLVLGGTGRVGIEAIVSLVHLATAMNLRITVSGRDARRGARACIVLAERCAGHSATFTFRHVDLGDNADDTNDAALDASLCDAMHRQDVVLHAAGPFQRRRRPTAVLDCAVRMGACYIDVSDDAAHSQCCKQRHEVAQQRGVRALVSTGIYPGVSNALAALACDRVTGHDNDSHVSSLQLYYHTAGSGGVGPTVLATTFLLLSERARAFDNGTEVLHVPGSGVEWFDFGGQVGRRRVFHLHLPEAGTLHDIVAPHATLCAKFGTAPDVWNALLIAMARWTPSSWLRDPVFADLLARVSIPVVRAVDAAFGARVAISVLAAGPRGRARVDLEHGSLADVVGHGVAAFALPLIRAHCGAADGGIPPGVWYPEELTADVRENVVQDATNLVNRFDVCVE